MSGPKGASHCRTSWNPVPVQLQKGFKFKVEGEEFRASGLGFRPEVYVLLDSMFRISGLGPFDMLSSPTPSLLR